MIDPLTQHNFAPEVDTLNPVLFRDYSAYSDRVHLDHYFPIAEAEGAGAAYFKACWQEAFAHLPENLRPAPDPNSIINMRFCDPAENMSKGKKIPAKEDLFRLWRINYDNLLENEPILLAAKNISAFSALNYMDLIDERAIDSFDPAQSEAYHIYRVYEAFEIAMNEAARTGERFQGVAGFDFAEHWPHVQKMLAVTYPLRFGQIMPVTPLPSGEGTSLSKIADRFLNAGYKNIPEGFTQGSVIDTKDLERIFDKFRLLAEARLPMLLLLIRDDCKARSEQPDVPIGREDDPRWGLA